ncbi:MAG TPA: hypothetical protein VNU97_11770 [Rhizomicrobium sp.]|jgi:hypothetical protein|nr:hypothetical protein [Rhizomicrobium sp.]
MTVIRPAIVAFVVLAAAVSPVRAAPCGGVTGLYTGTAQTPDGVRADITLNLFCDKNDYAAQLFTSMGDFAVKAASATQSRVQVSFDSGASLGTFDLTANGTVLAGGFTLADDKGTVALTRTGEALAADAMTPRLDLTPAQWREDLHVLAAELPRRHANAFFLLPRAKFDAEIAALDARLDTANSDEIFVGLQQIVKSIGDGHTGLGSPPPDRRVMPIAIARFGEDFRIVATGPGLDKALGARIVAIGGVPIGDVWRRVLTLTPQGELMQLRESDALIYLARGYALHGLDVIADRNHAVYTLMDDAGRTFAMDVAGLKPGETVAMKSGYSDTALRFQNADDPFWCKNLPDRRAVYCGWHSYQDLKAKAAAMFALIARVKPQKLIIDMRDNGGGDNTVGDGELVEPIRARADLNAHGHLFVLIGPLTFSAAMNNAAQFQDETNAILAGETIGEKPNSYQEPRQFRLPNSHLVVRASTLYYTFRKTGENAVRPGAEIIPTWDDVRSGRDPVLDWVLAQPVN